MCDASAQAAARRRRGISRLQSLRGAERRWARSPASSRSSASDRGYEPVAERAEDLEGVRPAAAATPRSAEQARALHGLRHPVLPQRLPGQQHDPRLERPGLPRPAGRTALENAALDQQLPGVHRPHLPRAVRGGLHAEHQRRPGHHQVDRVRDRRPRLGGRLGRAAAAGAARPASASPSSAPARPAWPARSSSRAPATR